LGVLYPDYNLGQMPAYHRMDVSIRKQIEFSKRSVLETIFSVSNLYIRANIFYYGRITDSRINQLPLMLSIGEN